MKVKLSHKIVLLNQIKGGGKDRKLLSGNEDIAMRLSYSKLMNTCFPSSYCERLGCKCSAVPTLSPRLSNSCPVTTDLPQPLIQ